MRTSNKHFSSGLVSLLYNTSAGQNNNENLNESQIQYYRGILVSCVQLTMKFYDCDYYYAMKQIFWLAPLDSYYIIYHSLPESWKKDWVELTKITFVND